MHSYVCLILLLLWATIADDLFSLAQNPRDGWNSRRDLFDRPLHSILWEIRIRRHFGIYSRLGSGQSLTSICLVSISRIPSTTVVLHLRRRTKGWEFSNFEFLPSLSEYCPATQDILECESSNCDKESPESESDTESMTTSRVVFLRWTDDFAFGMLSVDSPLPIDALSSSARLTWVGTPKWHGSSTVYFREENGASSPSTTRLQYCFSEVLPRLQLEHVVVGVDRSLRERVAFGTPSR